MVAVYGGKWDRSDTDNHKGKLHTLRRFSSIDLTVVVPKRTVHLKVFKRALSANFTRLIAETLTQNMSNNFGTVQSSEVYIPNQCSGCYKVFDSNLLSLVRISLISVIFVLQSS